MLNKESDNQDNTDNDEQNMGLKSIPLPSSQGPSPFLQHPSSSCFYVFPTFQNLFWPWFLISCLSCFLASLSNFVFSFVPPMSYLQKMNERITFSSAPIQALSQQSYSVYSITYSCFILSYLTSLHNHQNICTRTFGNVLNSKNLLSSNSVPNLIDAIIINATLLTQFFGYRINNSNLIDTNFQLQD